MKIDPLCYPYHFKAWIFSTLYFCKSAKNIFPNLGQVSWEQVTYLLFFKPIDLYFLQVEVKNSVDIYDMCLLANFQLQHTFFEQYLYHLYFLLQVLRLMCMQSVTNNGLKQKIYDYYRREILQVSEIMWLCHVKSTFFFYIKVKEILLMR